MKYASGVSAFLLIGSTCLSAAAVKGTVADPSGAAIGGARIAIVDRVGVEAQTVSAANGTFELYTPDTLPGGAKLVVTAPGFQTRELLWSGGQPVAMRPGNEENRFRVDLPDVADQDARSRVHDLRARG